jgi:murein DD-endopeptidase MepM/ murein hydrolase activator NlpD
MAARTHPALPAVAAIVLALLLVLGAGTSAAWPRPSEPALTDDDSWRWPVDPPRSIARPFIPPPTPYAAGHRGIDIRAPTGTLYAPESGVVHFAGVVVDRPVLSIDHGGGVISSYEPVATTLVEGDAVTRGDVIGTVLPGHCATVCVHLGVRVDGQYVSPLRFLGGIPRAILLPTR